jgi:hypothetical protein
MKVHGKGVEPLRLAAAEPKAALASENSRGIEKTSPIGDPSGPEIGGVHPGVGQSWGNRASSGAGEDHVEGALGEKTQKITRSDLASFMLAQLSNNEHLHKAVTIADS